MCPFKVTRGHYESDLEITLDFLMSTNEHTNRLTSGSRWYLNGRSFISRQVQLDAGSLTTYYYYIMIMKQNLEINIY